jgi:hypothetical protein
VTAGDGAGGAGGSTGAGSTTTVGDTTMPSSAWAEGEKAAPNANTASAVVAPATLRVCGRRNRI